MIANHTLLGRKYAHVVQAFAVRQDIGLRQALDIFYKSYTYQEMKEGISDMHCRSDEYLAEEIARELEAFIKQKSDSCYDGRLEHVR